ncbi:hypothetical protein D3879_15540 [Pseudomonas cavernicola]|uniref:Uncharacterized protein n=1 Tax=Pseudomonas cavernicola TaxID=2320866 RepID=A0A418XFB5_9PSED|nr:tetratricopeptide repeat protein [Pseudomonas cavernicola]RJG11078.1 hypothetical protein D3879_15540 [Pseudomonas cavernicola]
MPKHKKSPVTAPLTTPTKRSFSHIYLILAGLLLLVTLGIWLFLQRSTPQAVIAPATVATPQAAKPITTPASFVDETQCQGCHSEQVKDWQGSHHQMAMLPAANGNVLGNFNAVTFKGEAETTRFTQRDGAYWINTPGPDGKAADFKVAYTFGIEPLQQYLIEMPGGRLQASGVAWDTQKNQWFELYPGQKIDFKDDLHWSKPTQNANFMCVECHTTDFKRNFDAKTNSFASHWQSLGVGCQSCHGPASKHLEWSATKKPAKDQETAKGFDVSLLKTNATTQVETCARCHARRAPLGDGFQHKNRLMDDYLPSALTRELYEIDGKIKEEVFEYGSFTQSKMFAKGVTCTDCHNPHSNELKAPGNGVCLQCHNPSGKPAREGIDGSGLQAKNYDSPEHHKHKVGQAGSQCVDCHMPGKLYMVNDYRHDHSFSIPNPAHVSKLGSTDACLGCHRETSSSKVAQQFKLWYGETAVHDGGYADALHQARNGLPGAARMLKQQLERTDLPAIRRATLLAELPNYPSQRSLELAAVALNNSAPQVREAAIDVVSVLSPAQQQIGLLTPRLSDPVRAVRIAAAWQLAQLPEQDRAPIAKLWQPVIREYEDVQNSLKERAEANLNLAMLYQNTGRITLAEPALRDALLRNPDFLPAVVTLVQLLDAQGRTNEARQLLEENLARHPDAALLQHTQGLALVRRGEPDKALLALRKAAQLAPENPQFSFVLAIALHDSGQQEAARKQLEDLLKRQPTNRNARLALISYWHEAGQMQEVQVLQAELEQQNPDDPELQQTR